MSCRPLDFFLTSLPLEDQERALQGPFMLRGPILLWAGVLAVLDRSMLAESCRPVSWLQTLTAPASVTVLPLLRGWGGKVTNS